MPAPSRPPSALGLVPLGWAGTGQHLGACSAMRYAAGAALLNSSRLELPPHGPHTGLRPSWPLTAPTLALFAFGTSAHHTNQSGIRGPSHPAHIEKPLAGPQLGAKKIEDRVHPTKN